MGASCSQAQINIDASDFNSKCLTIIWLDANTNHTDEHKQMQHSLNTPDQDLIFFGKMSLCEQYLNTCEISKQILLIASGSMGEIFVPKIHGVINVCAIYIFCKNRDYHATWSASYEKIKGVITDANELVKEISNTVALIKKANERIGFSINAENAGSFTELGGDFIHFQLLCDCLLRMPPDANEKHAYLSYCKELFANNKKHLETVSQLKKSYVADQAILWYTKETFLYKMLNEALRTQNIDVLFLMRFFIRDLQHMLDMHQTNHELHVYRGQKISQSEFHSLQQSLNHILSFKSFLSASLDEKRADEFVQVGSDYVPVLFDIKVKPPLTKKQLVADISLLSEFREEQEVLFMLGCLFRLESILPYRDGCYKISLILCDGDDEKSSRILDYMKKEYANENGETDLLSFGFVLYNMGKYDKAETYFQMLLTLPNHYENIFRCLLNLGKVANARGAYDKSLDYYMKSIELTKRQPFHNNRDIIQVYIFMASIYETKAEDDDAIEAYQKALCLSQDMNERNHSLMACCLNNIGNIHQKNKRYIAALECHQKAIDIHEQYSPTEYLRLSAFENNIGIDYEGIKNYPIALIHLEKSLKLKKDVLPATHVDIAKTLASIGHVLLGLNDFVKALKYFDEAALIFRTHFNLDHPCILQIERDKELAFSLLKK